MAFKRFKSGNIQSATITTVYTVPSNSTANVSQFVLTNLTTNDIGVSIYVNDGAADRLIESVTIPAGIGRTKSVFSAYGSYNGSDVIKLDADSADSFDYIISGREN